MKASPIDIKWHPALPVFAREEFLNAVGAKCGWLGGRDESGNIRCFLPYTILRKFGFRLVRFRTETVACGENLSVPEEKSFLNSVVEHFRSVGADVIIPGTNNAIFQTYPDGADAAPYGSYFIDLRQSEETLWRNIDRIVRQNINTAQKAGISINEGMQYLDPAFNLIRRTFDRSKLPFMKLEAFRRFALGLGDYGKLLMAEYQGVPQTYCLFGFSEHCAYAIYAGNVVGQHQGAMKLLQWHAIRQFRSLGVKKFDFVGARIDPAKGSKQEALNMMKKRLGAELSEGYMWKYPLRPLRSLAYSLTVRYLRGGDIVDQERHKMDSYSPSIAVDSIPA
jgi:hypothetical protein